LKRVSLSGHDFVLSVLRTSFASTPFTNFSPGGIEMWFWYLITSLVQRLRRETRVCCGCGALHRRRNSCDNSFSAFCTDDCYAETMEENYPNG
jgi:hypothetical protein